ncbi:hypothetical protein BC939DRAFT_499409 [Gamsiella multidivaricata]|uniref:uncharacterized protein n=1 Tax=Gamsiella multidivaricata TaxID=101098 RepID=UPI00222038D6|nr:uncharacterized protein BC939DRAFT_499409 [Gamsiella multidivaricata]KAG0356206.1 hypothetical protein BGZ54_000810 [Gamsiella multidivaricata]KAI7830697.1 hypothetical protein BC939DRAFT_499409 [Gamsiella multidivaricata]
MIFPRKPLPYSATVATWIICSLWISQIANAAPLPQSSTDTASPTNNTLIDPFSTPSYLAPSKFTWEQGIYGILFIFFGGVELLHGYKYIRFTMLVAGFLVWASTAVMIMLITNISTGIYQSTTVYFVVWFFIGIAGAIVSFYLWHVGIILTGAYGMFVVVAVVFTAGNVTNYIFRYTVLAICVVAGGYLTKRYERMAVILATSLGGAYCIMFGLDMFVQDQFRTTFHVMLSQSSAAFYPTAGTWVMIACVPIIAAFGVVWELKHHEEPVGSWWFGQGAKPLPPLPGEKPPRRCCGCLLSRSAKAAATAEKSKVSDPTAALTDMSANFGSDTTLVPPPAKSRSHWACCFPLRSKKGQGDGKKPVDTTSGPSSSTSETAPHTPTSGEVMEEKLISSSPASEGSSPPSPPEKAYIGHETIGHTGVRKVVIQREEREFSLEVDERL